MKDPYASLDPGAQYVHDLEERCDALALESGAAQQRLLDAAAEALALKERLKELSERLMAREEVLAEVQGYAVALEASLSSVRLEARRQRERSEGVVSEPGNAWDVVVADRDEWKRRALEAERLLREAHAAIYEAHERKDLDLA